ncbi:MULTISPECIES: hypothetical protein [Photobacterium]|uniref:hypothetical protein n=1 Tax=Photobacterium TaxID=657 RepID=UPI001E580ED6|nr:MULTISPECIES: hypothetical protein [Photobacterium]MCD9477239.1 hypothetical protein [Photobacterium phosphoreum]MCD9508774.1 hypothetical protein [Photobacterium phosphoreum]MCD9539307.1 hypothetical protein [Photobacterium carnosum]MCD9543026.1 hypothetical protein [Photobacterium carnosum]MCD9546805.1 hypothetical protein [Photobacterium carnosum]
MVSTTIKGPQFYFQSDNTAHQQIVTFLDGLKASQRGSKSQAITRLLQAGLYLEALDSTLPDLIVRDLERGLAPDFSRLAKLYKVLQMSNVDIDEAMTNEVLPTVSHKPEPKPEPKPELEPKPKPKPEPELEPEPKPEIQLKTESIRPASSVDKARGTQSIPITSEHIVTNQNNQPSGFSALAMSFMDD